MRTPTPTPTPTPAPGPGPTPAPDSWTPDKPFPNNPSELWPGWVKDTGFRAPNDENWINPSTGNGVQWHPAMPGEPGDKGKDHWHWMPGGTKEKRHYYPGQKVRMFNRQIIGGLSVGAGGYITYRIIRMIPSLFPTLWGTIPANVAIP